MKTSRVVILVLVVVIVAIIAISVIAELLTPPSSSPWKTAAEYPLQVSDTAGVSGQQCVNSTVYIYCIGGVDALGGPRNLVYTSSAISSSSDDITGWTPDTNLYPQSIYAQACVVSSDYVYCVGGTYDDAGDDVASSYYASLSSDGVVGAWTSTTAYHVPVDSQYCVASSGYVYCVGGWTEEDGTNATRALSNSVYYAPLSSSGIGSWSQSTPYPANTYFPSCFAADSYIYCLGGVEGNGNVQSTDYYAPLSSSGVGMWTQTTAYPLQETGQACAISSGYIYCVGGEESSSFTNAVYFATVSSGVIGTWTKTANYPLSVLTNCVISSGNLYCVGGYDSSADYGAAYYISLNSLIAATTTTSS
jgi:hypothetical protein